jgi:predicted DNA-binding transcriptional regulator AlpA
VNKRKAAREPEVLPQPDLFGEADHNIANARRTRLEKPKTSSTRAPIASPTRTSGLLNVRQAAVRLGLSKSTLDKMRAAGKGPRYVKTTDRAVRYDPTDLDHWITVRRKQTTNQ